MVLAHVEQCDSCARFQHQLDQVIQSAPEVPLPDECLPATLESLAKRIINELPQQKAGLLGIFDAIFPFFGKLAASPAKPKAKPKAAGKDKQKQTQSQSQSQEEQSDSLSGQGMFPHVRRQDTPARSAKKAVTIDEELLATSARLRSQKQKLQGLEEPQALSQGQSLGTKFGVNVPVRDGASVEDGPLTLAESIRRKVVEEKQQDVQTASGSQNLAQPAAMTGQASGGAYGGDPQFAAGQQFGNQANQGQNFAQPGQTPGFGQGQPFPSGFPQAPGQGGLAAQAPGGAQGQSMQSGAATGGWGDAALQPPARGGFNEPPVPGVGGDSDWRPSAPAAPASDWQIARPQTPAWSTSGQQTWGTPRAEGANPSVQGVPAAQSGQDWAGGSPAPRQDTSGWTQPTGSAWPAQQPQWAQPGNSQPLPELQSQAGSFNQSQWGKSVQDPQTISGNLNMGGNPAANPNSNPNQVAGGWGQPSGEQATAYGAGTGASSGFSSGGQSGWGGSPQAQPAAPSSWSTQAQDSGFANNNQQFAGGGSWNQAPSAPPMPSLPEPGTGSGGNSWAPAPQSWDPSAASGQSAFGNPLPPHPGQAPAPASGDMPVSNQFLTSAPAPAAPAAARNDGFDSWSEEGEQIQTGMWQAFQLAEPELGQPKAQQTVGRPLPLPGQPGADAPPMPGAGQASQYGAASGAPGANMYDLSIQERMRLQQQGQPAQTEVPGAAMYSAPTVPSQSAPAMRQPSAAPSVPPIPPSPPAPAAALPPPVPAAALPPPAPAAALPPPAPAAAQGKHTIMDRLNKVLGEDLTAMAGNSAPDYQSSPPPPAPPPPPPPALPPAQPQAPAAASAAPSQAAAGLFRLDDKAIDKVFQENLGVNDPARPVGGYPSAPPPVPNAVANANPQSAPYAQPAATPGQAAQAPRISAVQPRQAQAAQAQPAPAIAQGPAEGGLFKLDDRAIDKVFKENLGVKETAQPVNAASLPVAPPTPVAPPVQQQSNWAAAPAMQQPAAPGLPQPPMPQPAPPLPAPQAAANLRSGQAGSVPPAKAPGALLNVDDDAMDRIFSDLGVKEKAAAQPKFNVRDAVQQIRTLSDVPMPPKVAGIDRLSQIEMVPEPSLGKINAIGKFLLDQQDLAKIGRITEQDLSETKVRVLTHEASDEINRLLEHIATQPGVVGSVIVGHDGILIANSLPREHDPETIGILSLGIYINTTNSTKKIGHNHLHQLVCRTQAGYLVIADFGGGILVTVSNALDTDKLIPLMRSITQLVAQT